MPFGLRFLLPLLAAALLVLAPAHAQETDTTRRLPTDTTAAPMPNPVTPSPAGTRLKGFRQKQQMLRSSMLAEVPFESAGPTIMSGRVVDLAVDPTDPTTFYVAYASGGLWRTTNNGRTFTPLFDDQAAMTIGDIAVDWKRGGQTLWIGTGENNSSRSSYAGTGLYKSTDRGETWQHMGLAGTQRTGRVRIHPDDPQTVWVAALGPLYHSGDHRGVYKTTDGGETWDKTLFINEDTGAIDLEVRPGSPQTLYATTWHRERRAWNFVEAGNGSGIFESTDGGDSWQKISTEESGFPTGPGVGRIGLALYSQDPDVMYALVDNQYRRPEDPDEDVPDLTRDMIREMGRAEFLEVGEEALEAYLRRNGFPASYTAASILEMIRAGDLDPIDLVRYLEGANEQRFETPVKGAEVYRSTDGGQTWEKTHEEPIDEMFYSYGYYFGQIRVAPQDPEKIYVMGVPILRSDDGGETFRSISEENVHVDHHALWVNPNRPGHLVNGNDGGVNVSYDDGETWFKNNTPPVSQFYTVAYDMQEPYHVYGGMQDNGVWGGPHTYDARSYSWRGEGNYPYERLMGGDGMKVEIDTREDHPFVYTGYQFGYYFRINRETGERTLVQPSHELGERPLRFNWMTPIHLSSHNQDVLYLGSNKLHRSLDRGETWTTLSEDLTGGTRKGDVPYGTLTTLDESPLKFGLLWVGTDDGRVHVSRDGGTTWQNVSEGLPEDLWVSRVEASDYEKGRAYVTLTGYRYDHFPAYVYRTDDYGRSWTRIGKGLPPEPANVIAEDPENEDVLYLGTDHSIFVSLDRGETFAPLGGLAADPEGQGAMEESGPFPNAPVHDLKVHPRENELIVGTHGRSIYTADVAPIQQLTPALRKEPAHLFATDSLRYDAGWGEAGAAWMEPGTPAVTFTYYARAAGPATIRVQQQASSEGERGRTLRTLRDTARRGLNYVRYNLSANAEAAEAVAQQQREAKGEDEETPPVMEPSADGVAYLTPGTYRVEVETAAGTTTGTLTVRPPASGEGRYAIPGPEELNEKYGR
jgi:photosystem II stability/assembly factor-like uncharacterized protein